MGSEQEKGSIEHATKAPEAEHELLEEAKSQSSSSSSSSRASMELDVDRDSHVDDPIAKSMTDEVSKILEEAKSQSSSSSSRASLELDVDRDSHVDDSIAKSMTDEDSKILEEAKSQSPSSLELDIDRDSHVNDSIAKSMTDEDSKILEEAKSQSSSSSSSSRSSLELDIDINNHVDDSIANSMCGEESKILEEARTRQLPSASLLTSSSSSRASLELDVDRNSHLNDSIAKSKSEGDLSSQGQESMCTRNSPARTPQWSMASASPPVGLEGHFSQTASPPVQTMESCSGYDPDRIPASVFSSKATNEWSTASNESLFSIHMGNNSLAMDQFPRLDSLYGLEAKSSELCSLPPLMEVPSNEECSVKSSNASVLEKDDPMDSPKGSPGATHGASTPRLSVESGQSTSSFAFPVLVNGGGKGSSSLGQAEERSEVQTQEAEGDQKSATTTSRCCSWLCCLPRCC